jgi:lysophospholipase L1-like esterase
VRGSRPPLDVHRRLISYRRSPGTCIAIEEVDMRQRLLRTALALIVLATSLVLTAVPAHAAEPLRIMVVGDSITQGSAGDWPWRVFLYEHLKATNQAAAVDFVGDRDDLYDNVNERHGSHDYGSPPEDSRSHHALWGRPLIYEKDTIRAAVAANRAQLIMVALGVNDFAWFGATPAQVAGYMDEFITNARAANPSIRIIIGDVLSRYDFWNSRYIGREQADDVNRRFTALATARSTSTSPITFARTSAGWDPADMTWDGVHPSALGSYTIAKGFAQAFYVMTGIGGLDFRSDFVPEKKRWYFYAMALTATPVDGGVRLNWVPTPGATGYVIEQMIHSLGETYFRALPYPMPGNTFSWTARGLLPGWDVSYRVVPVKGVTFGFTGPGERITVGGTRPTDRPSLFGAPGSSNHLVRLSWTAVDHATGYYIEMMDLAASTLSWLRLPWQVTANSFDPGALQPGHWYRWRVIPANGALLGPASNTVDLRTTGTSNYLGYYALGDSFSSGLGTLGTAGSYTGGDCKRSSQAWPYLARAAWEPSPTHLACASAKIPEMLSNQVNRIPQNPGTVLISFTIGGNDVGFGPIAKDCWTGDCTGQEDGIAAKIDALGDDLRAAYRAVKARAPGADIVVAGYPKLILPPETANCTAIFGSGVPGIGDGFRDDEKRMIRRLATRLNGVIQRAGADEDVVVAVREVSEWFDGHEACSGFGEYINQIAECTTLPFCFGTLHPTYNGQLAYALAVNQRRRDLAEYGFVRY